MTIFTVSSIFCCCCNYQDFAYRSKLLTTRVLRQGYVYQKLCRTYKTFVHRYPKTIQKYRRCLKNIITECIASPTITQPEHVVYSASTFIKTHTAFKHTLFALLCLSCALIAINTSGTSSTSVCARMHTFTH